MLIKLRLAKPQDADALLEIYAPYVKQTAISFEYDVPGAAEFAERIEQTLQRYPYLLAYVSDEAACADDERNENFKISASAAAAESEILPANEARNCASGAAKQNGANLIVAAKQSGVNLKPRPNPRLCLRFGFQRARGIRLVGGELGLCIAKRARSWYRQAALRSATACSRGSKHRKHERLHRLRG